MASANQTRSNSTAMSPMGNASITGSSSSNADVKKNDHNFPGHPSSDRRSGKSSLFQGHSGGKQRRQSNPGTAGTNYDSVKRCPKSNKNRSKRFQQKSLPSDSNGRSIAEADESEVGSVFNGGSKKQSLNHLLNFRFTPRNVQDHDYYRKDARKYHSYFKKQPTFKKEQYLQANCQFVVGTGNNVDYSSYLTDADTLVDWDLIEEVRLKTGDKVPSCPICLYPPVAAKMWKCGHIFCWPCILHYHALSDNEWRKCPICFVNVCKKEIKSVVSLTHKSFLIGQEIKMFLMRRERHSLFAVPVDQYYQDLNLSHANIEDMLNSHSKLLLATPEQISRLVLKRERMELEQKYENEKEEPESVFIEEALQHLSLREQALLEFDFSESRRTDPSNGAVPCEKNSNPSSRKHSSSSSVNEEPISADKSVRRRPVAKETFYFYQSFDGQPIFLHALNISMLIQEFGSLENCPSVIRGKIVEKDHCTMDEDIRDKLRYLQHLPLSARFEVCEIKFQDPQLSKETVAAFHDKVDARKKKRKKRDKEEKIRDKKIQIEENINVFGKYPENTVRIESQFHFPEIYSSSHSPEQEGGGAIDVTAEHDFEGHENSAFPELLIDPNPNLNNNSSSGCSFAAKLRQSRSQMAPNAWSGLKRSDTFPVNSSGTTVKNLTGSDSEDQFELPDGYGPRQPAQLCDAVALALENASLNENASQKNSKKKKKGKKMSGIKINLTSAAGPNL